MFQDTNSIKTIEVSDLEKKLVVQKYKAPIRKNCIPPYTARCPLNTIYIDWESFSDDGVIKPNTNLIKTIFKVYDGFIELKDVENQTFITYKDTEAAKNAIEDYYKTFNFKNIYVTYANNPTFTTNNKEYVYQKYKRSISAQ